MKPGDAVRRKDKRRRDVVGVVVAVDNHYAFVRWPTKTGFRHGRVELINLLPADKPVRKP